MDEYRSLLAPYMQSFLQYRKALFHKNSAYLEDCEIFHFLLK